MSETVRVLVVDDEELIRWSVAERLTRKGYAVDTAESGEEALGLMASSPPDVIVLDVRLPGIDGLAVLGKALVVNPDTPVLMMSAHGTVDLAVEAMKRGAVDFLMKPFSREALEGAVERAVSLARMRRQIAGRTAARPDAAGALVGSSAAMQEIRNLVGRLASSDATTVLVEGESGVGKEVVAGVIHRASARAERPFVQLNCAALAETLLESELFGHERGAFTDARAQKAGLFETAAGGTVFLDEIGDMPASGQAKLLRLLENKTFRRVGGVAELTTDVRVIAATNANLEERVGQGRFRADLYFRLKVIRIPVPPLRERPEDVPDLCAHFVARFNEIMKREVRGVAPEAMAALAAYSWPGNVRELRNAVERAYTLYPATELRLEHLPAEVRQPRAPGGEATAPDSIIALDDAERLLIQKAIEQAGGNQTQAAKMLGVTRFTLRYRLKKHGLDH